MKALKKMALFCIAVLMVVGVYAQPQQRGTKEVDQRRAKMALMMKKRQAGFEGQRHFAINLTDEQKEEMKEARIELHKKIKPLNNKLNELKAQQKSLVDAEKVDFKAVNNNIDKMKGVEAEIAKLRVENMVAMKSLLTEEQQMKMEMMHKKKGHKGSSRTGERSHFQRR